MDWSVAALRIVKVKSMTWRLVYQGSGEALTSRGQGPPLLPTQAWPVGTAGLPWRALAASTGQEIPEADGAKGTSGWVVVSPIFSKPLSATRLADCLALPSLCSPRKWRLGDLLPQAVPGTVWANGQCITGVQTGRGGRGSDARAHVAAAGYPYLYWKRVRSLPTAGHIGQSISPWPWVPSDWV